MNTTRVLLKISKMVTRTRPRSTAKTSPMSKVPSKINNFEGLEKVCHTFSQTFFGRDMTCLTKPRQRTIRKISLLIEYGRARFVTHIVTHHIWPTKKKGQIPTLNLHSFSKHFSNIYLFPDLTIFVLTIPFRRRFDRTFRETLLTSRPEIRSDSGNDGPLTALTTPMI